MTSLMRYKDKFNLNTRPNVGKGELIEIIKQHFMEQSQLKDDEVIGQFLFANKRYLKQEQSK
jgi:hypothetical protein